MSASLPATKLFEGLLAEEGAELWALLDGASIPNLLERLHAESKLEVACLFRGALEPDMRQVAPYLVKLDPEGELADWVASGWAQHWGSFVVSRGGLIKLREHLRALTLVHRSDGTPLYFRYYDPRVLRVFLPTCSPAQLRQMFGPVDAFLCENEAGDAMSVFRLNGSELSAVQRKLA